MKQFFLRSRSIAGAIAWGAITAFVVFFGLIIADLIMTAHQKDFGPARQIDAIAVGNGYSISLDATPTHAFLAEYEQSIRVFGGSPRRGGLLGRLLIPANTGGQIRIGVLVPRDKARTEVFLADRYQTTHIDLPSQKAYTQPTEPTHDPALLPLGIISGASNPVKFIPCSVWSHLSSEEQKEIIRPGDTLQDFCGTGQ